MCISPSWSLSLSSSLSLHLSALTASLSLILLLQPENELGQDVRLPPHGSSPRALVGRASSAGSLSLATREESGWEPLLRHRRRVSSLRLRRPPASIPAGTGLLPPRRRLHRFQGDKLSRPDILPSLLDPWFIGAVTAVLRRRISSPPACKGSPRVTPRCLGDGPCHAVAVCANEKLRGARFRRRRRGNGRRPGSLRQLDVTRGRCLADLRALPGRFKPASARERRSAGPACGFRPEKPPAPLSVFKSNKNPQKSMLFAFASKMQPKT